LRGAGADARRSAESHRCKTAQRKLALVHSLQRRAPVSSLPEIERYPLVIVRPPRPLGDAPPERRAGGARAAVSADSEGSHSLQFPTSTHASPFGAQVPQMQLQGALRRTARPGRSSERRREARRRLARAPCVRLRQAQVWLAMAAWIAWIGAVSRRARGGTARGLASRTPAHQG
jgi:hypothetical protein